MRWWQKYRDWLRRRRGPDPLIRMVGGGFDVVSASDGRALAKVRWQEVARIQTFKLDLLTTDCICLRFELTCEQPAVQISEEWEGFADLFGPLRAAFPSLPEDWYQEAMMPPFETSRRVLYEAPRTG